MLINIGFFCFYHFILLCTTVFFNFYFEEFLIFGIVHVFLLWRINIHVLGKVHGRILCCLFNQSFSK